MIRGMTVPSFMDLALKTAENAGKAGEVPIGCVIVRGYEVIATAGNRTLTDRDPTAHAEILAIRQAAEAIGTERLVDCDLYVTLEPCTMCAGAISFARIRRLYYGAADPKGGAVDSGVRFFAQPTCAPRAGGLFRGRRDRGGDAAQGIFQGAAVDVRSPVRVISSECGKYRGRLIPDAAALPSRATIVTPPEKTPATTSPSHPGSLPAGNARNPPAPPPHSSPISSTYRAASSRHSQHRHRPTAPASGP